MPESRNHAGAVRQWRRRIQAEFDIRHLLGEEPNKGGGKRVEDKNALAAEHLQKLCKLVLSDREGDDERAQQLASFGGGEVRIWVLTGMDSGPRSP